LEHRQRREQSDDQGSPSVSGRLRPFIAGDHFSAADITGLVTVDFAAKAISFPVPNEHNALRRWFEKVSSRPSAGA
jgi:glutathione S-transferase